MKPILFILGPIVIFGILITGGLQITDPQKVGPGSTFTDLVDQNFTAVNTLQIRNLVRGSAITPSPTSPPGTTPSPTGPTPTTPPFVTQPPTPTPTPGCRAPGSIALNLLLDESDTMNTANRLSELKIALGKLVGLLRDNDLIGIQAFSDPRQYGTGKGARVVVEIDTYKNNLNNGLLGKVNSLGKSGDTHMKDGFELARQQIDNAKRNSRFNNRTWIMVFLSDGIPNDMNVGGDGPDPSQDPRPIDQQIRPLVSRLISVWIHPGHFTGTQEAYATSLMPVLAYGPGVNYYKITSSGEFQVKWDAVDRSICNL